MRSGAGDDPKPHLRDIVDWGGRLGRRVGAHSEASFLADEVVQESVLYCLLVIGEASGQVLKRRLAFRDERLLHDLQQAYRLRNVAAHAYSTIVPETIWGAATRDVPRLVAAVLRELAE